jgi:trigger factor
MQTTCKKLPQSRTQCTIVFSPEEVSKAEAEALAHIGEHVNLPGFRPGKAPPDMVRSNVDAAELLEHMVRHLATPILRTLPAEQNLKPILSPRLSVEKTDPLTISVIFVEKPDVKVKGAEKIKIEKKEKKFDDKDIDRMVRYLQDQYRTFSEADRPLKEGDQATIDFHGTDTEGKEVPGIRSRGYAVILGSKTLLPGFEDTLAGMKKGDQKSFPLTFPEKYHAEHLQGKNVTFHVTVTKVEDVNTPEMTDAFVKEHHLGESLPDLRKRIAESMTREEESVDRQRRERELFDKIREATKVDPAPELVQQAEQNLLEELEEELKRQNTTLEDWMKRAKKSPQDMHKEMEEQAKKRLQLRFGVEQLIEDRKIDVTEDELNALIKDILANAEEKDRLTLASRFTKGSEDYDQLKWQRQVEKLVEGILAQ